MSIEDLVREAYESHARLLDFPTDKLKKLPVVDEQVAAQGALVTSLAQADATLAGTFKLLQYVASRGVPLDRGESTPVNSALRRLRDLALMALGMHPVFRVWKKQLLDPESGPDLTAEIVRDFARKVTAEDLGIPEDRFKAADKERLARNAIASLSILRALQRDWTVDRFIYESNAAVWASAAPKGIGVEKAAALIGASREPDVLGLVVESYDAKIASLHRSVAKLESEADAARNRGVRLSTDLRAAAEREAAANARAESFSAEIVRLQKELRAERDHRVVDKSHMASDYETLRTRIVRRLSGEVDLLTDALHALRNGASPVAEEFLDRSLLALSREVEQLKDAAGGLA